MTACDCDSSTDDGNICTWKKNHSKRKYLRCETLGGKIDRVFAGTYSSCIA